MKFKLCKLCAGLLALALLLGVVCLPTGATSGSGSGSLPLPTALIPGGYPFGVRFTTMGVLVVGFRDVEVAGASHNPAKEAGVQLKDRIVAVNGSPIETAQQLSEVLAASGGAVVELTCLRGESELRISITPLQDGSGEHRTGLYVRDSGAGIGTLTYIDPETLQFGGLGHGICDVDTGALMPLRHGSVVGVTISGVKKGASGSPGELRGYFHQEKQGTLRSNTPCGVFGVLAAWETSDTEAIPVGRREELRVGDAEILCTLPSGERRAYRVTLSAIDRESRSSKCFSIHVTDPELIDQTGGIVQGMSGSPVIQNGKLVGAVTHVLVCDPTRGYGIFIENMLEAAS